jgi:hypothetical protein
MIQLPEYITASDYHDSTAVQQIYVALIFPVSCVDGWDPPFCSALMVPWTSPTNTPLCGGSGELWSSLILSTSTTAQAHGCKWYMSLTDAVAPCLLVHWQATTYRSKQWHRALFAGTSLYQVTCKIISLFSVLKRDPYMLVLDPWTEMGLIQTKKKR